MVAYVCRSKNKRRSQVSTPKKPIKLNRSHRLVANIACDKNDGRKMLTCVHVCKGKVEAADGFAWVRKKTDYQGKSDLLIPASKLKDCKDKEVSCVIQKDNSVIIQDGNTSHYVPRHDFETPYPKAADDVLINTKDEPVCKIALGKSLLQRVLKCLDKEEDIVRFYIFKRSDPVLFTVYPDEDAKKLPCGAWDAEVVGLIMPMYVNWEDKENPQARNIEQARRRK
jgi:hypothetical protein